MITILGDLIADLSIRIPSFPIAAQDLKPITYLEIGPGGATNIAIMAARFGLRVACLGELGTDPFGSIVRQGLEREGVDISGIFISDKTRTPVAGVLVDTQSEPAYLGYVGELYVKTLPSQWRARILASQGLFADGWVEIIQMPDMILEAFQMARDNGIPTFFDPGPGNPAIGSNWHKRAASMATILLLNADEATKLTKINEPLRAARALLENGSELVVLKRGAEGMTLVTAQAVVESPGYRVDALDLTGAGDSVTGAVMYGYLRGLALSQIGVLANATGAAKVQKLGTGHNMPTVDQVRSVLDRFAPQAGTFFQAPPC
jgi:sugar/nucleoside kinase (ribokinase family)